MRILRLCIVLAALWSLYWALAGYGLRSGITGWFAAREAEGWQAEIAAIEASGFPLRHETRLIEPVLADPRTGRAWSADHLIVDSPAIWPGHQSLRFPETAQYLSYFDDTQVLTARDMVADLDLAPGLALELQVLGMRAGDWTLTERDEMLASGAGATLAMTQSEEVGERYHVTLNIPDFTPGPRLRRLMGSAPSLPDKFQALAMDAEIRFDRPWDRRALEDRRPQPRQLDLKLFEIAWGPLRISAAGGFDVDEDGLPDGTISIRAENWREMLRMAQTAGALPPAAVQSAERALGFLANLGGRPETLDIQLNVTNGIVALGPLPLGPAPRLILR